MKKTESEEHVCVFEYKTTFPVMSFKQETDYGGNSKTTQYTHHIYSVSICACGKSVLERIGIC